MQPFFSNPSNIVKIKSHTTRMNQPQMSEHMARGFYTRWRDYLEGQDWDRHLGLSDPRFSDGEHVAAARQA